MSQQYKKGLKVCFVSGIIIGIIIGIAGFSVMVSYRMDQLYKKVAYLEQTIQDKNIVLEKFEKNINTWSLIIKGIEVVLAFDGDEIDKIQVEKNIKDKYATLLGKEVKKIDPDLIIEVVDKRIFKIDDKEYKLKVDRLILTEIMKIWISVEPV
ncbi:hypothetical protein [Desulfosporosinus sp.]|uniref:hypothetical protein n=1 Tax=Desulfosporosinus sp. TaxID=157907 RepID=UPI000E81C898|nr:hypothetical protein [Desulfosporosinus sp.]MBC2724971.1 hypothetical protein [Desulfosporosinus sp.]HBV87107.1 hypothetical protein [Desulfosporosinus sp.]